MEIVSSRETSSAGSTASSWINLYSESSKQGGSRSNGSQTVHIQAKIRQLEKTVAALQAQLQAPPSTTPKVTAFNAIVVLIKDNLPTEILVQTQSPQKRGRGEASGVFEPQTDPIQQLPWHKYVVRGFEACAHEASHLFTQSKRDEPSLWMGKYLKLGKLLHMRCTYLNQKVHPQPFTLLRVNPNLC